MRRWLGLSLVLASASVAAAEPAFTSAPLSGALASCVTSALGLVQEDLAAPSDRLGAFSGMKTLRPVEVSPPDGTGLTRDDISRVMYASAKQLRGCYQKELANDKDLSGKVVVTFRITETGTVADARVASTTLKSPPVESCILGEIGRLRFPPKAVATVTYPFIFSRG